LSDWPSGRHPAPVRQKNQKKISRTGQLTCVQNVIAGRGWRLDVMDLAKAVADGRANGPGVRVRMLTFLPHDELEGYRPLDGDQGLFVTSNQKNNVIVGDIKSITHRESRPER
jgi:hypothetical protein